MEDRTIEGYTALQDELKNLQTSLTKLKLKDSYKDSDTAGEHARAYNDIRMRIEKINKLLEVREYYLKQYKGCVVDVFLEAPFENCSLLGYEKQTIDVAYEALKPKKEKVLVGVDYRGTVSTINNSVTLKEEGYYDDIFVLEKVTKTVKTSFYVRVTKQNENTLKLDDKSFTYIDVCYFKKPSTATAKFKLFKIFNYISSFTLIAAFIITLLQTIGSNYIIGRQVSKGNLANLGEGFVKFFTSPALQIILLSLIAVYFISQIIVIICTKEYNKCVSTKNFEMLKNIPTQIVNTLTLITAFIFFMFTNTVSFAYCAAPNLPYGAASGIFSNVGIIEKFAEIAHLETTRTFTFASNVEAAIYLGGVAISFCELLCMLYVVTRIVVTVIEILIHYNNISEIEEDMYERTKLNEKNITEYENKLKEFNKNLVIIDDFNLYPGVSKRVPSVFDSESNLRKSRKISHLQNGRFDPYRLFFATIIVPIIGITFLVFDGIHDLCATGFFPGSNFAKGACYVVLIVILGGIALLGFKTHERNGKLDD